MQSGNGKGFIVIGAFVLLLIFLYVKSNEGTEVGSYEPPTTSWIDNLLGNDDEKRRQRRRWRRRRWRFLLEFAVRRL